MQILEKLTGCLTDYHTMDLASGAAWNKRGVVGTHKLLGKMQASIALPRIIHSCCITFAQQ